MIVWRGFNVQSPTSCNTAKAQLLIDIAVDENPGIGYENQIIKFIVEGENILKLYQQIRIFPNTSKKQQVFLYN